MVIVEDRPAEVELPPETDNVLEAAFYIKLKETIEVISILGWDVFIQLYHFNDLDNRISKLKKGQNLNKPAEETDVELDGEISMDAEIIGKFITQQVADAINKKTV